jgi:hypothetical protein
MLAEREITAGRGAGVLGGETAMRPAILLAAFAVAGCGVV